MARALTKTPLFVNKQPGGMFAIINETLSTGSYWFVDSSTGTDQAGSGQNPSDPVATLDYAIGLATASKADMIFVMPGHAETLSSAADITVDKIGLTITGLGNGANRPVFTIATTTSEAAPIKVSVASVTINNLRFDGGETGGSKEAISIAASDFIMDGCQFVETTATKELAITDAFGIITLDDSSAALTRIQFRNIEAHLAPAGDHESFITVNDGSNGVTDILLYNCDISGRFTDGIIQADAGTNVNTGKIQQCILANTLATGGIGACVQIDAGAIWMFTDDHLLSADGDAITANDVSACYFSNHNECESTAYSILTASGTGATNFGA